jgi:two-component system sensor histidine kinase KdpD
VRRLAESRRDVGHLLLALAAIGVVTKVYVSWLHITNDTTGALSYLLVILFVAASSRLWAALVTSTVAAILLDYFFLPPTGAFNITDPQDWIAFSSFIVVSVVASQLYAVARNRNQQALRLLEEQKQLEIAQRGIELKSALLASLAHDLRTPLTAIRLAVSNLVAAPSRLTDEQRDGQVDVALTGLDRLARLFQNILEMTQIDAGALAPAAQWVYPSEIITTARDQVDHALRAHVVRVVNRTNNHAVRLDPRLTSAALAHLLENAAQYSPRGSTITITHELTAEGLLLSVLDEGSGIVDAQLPHLFERFYRGAQAHRHISGTGVGLAIVQGLLAAVGGRVSAENAAGGGAQFTMVVPAESRLTDDDV